jgi:phospholipid/cholesterol/gamma-HCH transport system substrate-binding protein
MPSAERIAWAKFRVFVVCVVALVILGTLCYLLTGGTLFKETTTLHTFIPDATGLDQQSPVRVNGIDVGKVVSVSLSGSSDPNRIVKVLFTVELSRLPSITSDSSLQISTDTLVGDKFVDISTGKSPHSVSSGGEVPYQSQPALLTSLDLSQFEQVLRGIDSVLADMEEGRGPVGQFVVGEQLYDSVRKRVAEVQRSIHSAAEATGSVGRLVYTDQHHRAILDSVLRLDQSLAQLQSGQGTGGRLLEDSAQYEQFLAETRDLRKAIRSLRSTDLMQTDQMYRDWDQRVGSLIRSVDDFNASPLIGTTAMYDNLNGAARDWQKSMQMLRQNPKAYLRLKIF